MIANGMSIEERLANGSNRRKVLQRQLNRILKLLIASMLVYCAGWPIALVLFSIWILAIALGQIDRNLSMPLTISMAAISEIGWLTAASFVCSSVHLSVANQIVACTILLVPLLIGWVLLSLKAARLTLKQKNERNRVERTWLFSTCVPLIAFCAIKARGTYFGIAWAMSGDSRNHVQIMRGVLAAGGLGYAQLRAYPAVINNVAAIASSALGRSHLTPGVLMVRDVTSLAGTFILSLLLFATLNVAAVQEFSRFSSASGNSRSPSPVLAIAISFLCLTPVVLGIGLNEGFLSAIGALPIVVASTILTLSLSRDAHGIGYALLGASVFILFFTWTLMAVVPSAGIAVLVVLHIFEVLKTKRVVSIPKINLRSPRIILYLSLLPVVVIAYGVKGNLALLELQLSANGAIIPPRHSLVVIIVGAIVLTTLMLVRSGSWRQLFVVVAIVGIGAGASYLVTRLSAAPGSWNYYAEKSLWIILAAFLWVLFVPIELATSWIARRIPDHRSFFYQSGAFIQQVAPALLVLYGLNCVVGLAWPVFSAMQGWTFPTATEVKVDVAAGATTRPFVIWQFLDPNNDRLGNFWAALIWDTNGKGETVQFAGNSKDGNAVLWAYYNAPTSSSGLCNYAREAHPLAVFTAVGGLTGYVRRTCPDLGISVHLER